ncbi:hypothetical protein ACLOJK_039641 [Asimina triloba]
MKNRDDRQQLLSSDAVINILARVPPKSAIRFTCVCRRWNKLIRESCFIEKHLRLARRGLLFLLSSSHGDRAFLDLDGGKITSVRTREYIVHGSCNGLLCVRMRNMPQKKIEYFVYNPGINQLLNLSTDFVETSSCCDTIVAIGFVPSTSEYKVVRVSTDLKKKEFYEFCEICTVGRSRNSWRRLGQLPNFNDGGVLHPPICVDGRMHWIRSQKKHNGFSVILTLDLKTERFRIMRMPGGHSDLDANVKLYLVDWSGQLSSIKICNGHLIIWVLQQNGKWRRMANVSLESLLVIQESDYIRPLIIKSECELVFLYKENDIYSYNFKNNQLKTIFEKHRIIGSGAQKAENTIAIGSAREQLA